MTQEQIPQNTIVLVTGGTGYIARFTIVQLLKTCYQVRTTVRDLSKADIVRDSVKEGGQDPSNIKFYEADLLEDKGWSEATKNVDYVLHMASPFPSGATNQDDLIRAARDGTLRVLRAATAAKVKRVVVTSSIAAVTYGRAPSVLPYDENDWGCAETSGGYPKSKILAEKAAWDFVEKTSDAPEMTTIVPVAVFGPMLHDTISTSIGLIKNILIGASPFLLNTGFGVVDVRDIADLHVRAMTHPDAKGQRFLGASEGTSYSFAELGQILRDNLSVEEAARIPTYILPDTIVRLVGGYFNSLRPWVPSVGVVRKFNVQKGREVLGWRPRPCKDCIIAAARSLIDRKLV